MGILNTKPSPRNLSNGSFYCHQRVQKTIHVDFFPFVIRKLPTLVNVSTVLNSLLLILGVLAKSTIIVLRFVLYWSCVEKSLKVCIYSPLWAWFMIT